MGPSPFHSSRLRDTKRNLPHKPLTRAIAEVEVVVRRLVSRGVSLPLIDDRFWDPLDDAERFEKVPQAVNGEPTTVPSRRNPECFSDLEEVLVDSLAVDMVVATRVPRWPRL